jgi:tRNA pseudouridine55 synthase
MNDWEWVEEPKKEEPPPLEGIVLVDKPADKRITSMTVCRSVRRRLFAGGERGSKGTARSIKVGHAGTLDPLASGLLIVLVGKSTRLCESLMAAGKTYVAEVDVSRWSNTDDLEGVVESHGAIEEASESRVREVLGGFVGVIQQRPPVYSAMLVEGKRAYDLARGGRPPEMKERPIRIDALELEGLEWPRIRVRVDCGKGTYIRSLARDLGVALTGKPAVLTALRRTRIGAFGVEDATELNALPMAMGRGDLRKVT